MSSLSNDAILRIIKNTNSKDFKNRYVSMGKIDGKKFLREDCNRLKINVPLSGLQAIEKGYSSKERVTISNSDFRSGNVNYSLTGDEKKYIVKKPVDPIEKLRKREEEKEKLIAYKNKIELENKKQQKKELRWEKNKIKMSKLESWEDLV